ncbi:MAG: ketopantoate reductase family protein [Coriobacteriales bacterium]|jgi:2-dehydropantoate 2-reductase|nr:ketopantoate reductase family protein [Coriobacteriales bacterium]
MDRIALVGAGSLGTILGAYISKHRQIDLVDVNSEHVDTLNENGARVVGTLEMTVPVRAVTPKELEGYYDLVLLLVKQLYTDEALDQLEPHLKEDSIICTLQNGYPELHLIARYGVDRVMGCSVGWGATWLGPGVSELTSNPDHMSFQLGRIDGKITENLKDVESLLALMCPVFITNNLPGVRWAKLLTNATFSGLSAALGCTFGDILDDPVTSEYAQYLINEIIGVATASGVEELPTDGVDLGKYLRFSTEEKRQEVAVMVDTLWTPHRLLRASMLQDLEKGRRCEIDEINGIVSSEGKRVGRKTPFCDRVIEIVKNIEAGRSTYSMENLPLLEEVLKAERLS